MNSYFKSSLLLCIVAMLVFGDLAMGQRFTRLRQQTYNQQSKTSSQEPNPRTVSSPAVPASSVEWVVSLRHNSPILNAPHSPYLAFSPDGRKLVTISYRTTRAPYTGIVFYANTWDVNSGRLLGTRNVEDPDVISPQSLLDGKIFSPDRKKYAIVKDDERTVWIRNVP